MVTVQELIKMLKYLKSNEIVKILTKARTTIHNGGAATTALETNNKSDPKKTSMLMKIIEGEIQQSASTALNTSNLLSNIQNRQQISTITSSEITEAVAKQQQVEQHLQHNQQQQQQQNGDFKHKNNQIDDEQQQQQETYSSQQQTYLLFSFTSNLNGGGCDLVSAQLEGNKSNFINEIASTQDLENNNNRNPLKNISISTNSSSSSQIEKSELQKTPSVLSSEAASSASFSSVTSSPPTPASKLSSPEKIKAISPSYTQQQQRNQRSQRIQRFYQQQLHHFHTQPNQSLWAKQKLTKFAMSSLAAEPLTTSLKHEDFESIQQQIQQHQNPQPKQQNGISNSCHSNAGLTNSSTSSTDESNSSAANASGKPCFKTGLSEIIKFMELIGNLKHTKRTGWVLRDVNDCESISGHMYRMSILTFLLDGSEGLNQTRCMELALVHDMAESLVGDITPFCGITKDQKREMEFQAMEDICNLIKPRGKRIMELFEEYEKGESAESKFVKDLDRLDMVMQAFEYEKRDNCLLKHQEFFDSTEGKFNHPFVKKLISEIYEQRKTLAKDKGATPPDTVFVPEIKSSSSSASPAITNGYTTEPKTKNETSS